jgi:glycerophosphoryl diester phosphodiesterase
MLVIAHRGGPDRAPENTLAAFRTAIALGADGVELDCQRSRDGALVVIHDETVDRTTNGRGLVGNLTLAELRALDAGQGEAVPTFEEVLALAQAGGVQLVAEIKSPELYPGLELEMYRAVEAAGYLDHTIFISFDWEALKRLQAVSPTAQLGALYDQGHFNYNTAPAGVQFVGPMAEMALMAPGSLRPRRTGGRKAQVWIGKYELPWIYRRLRQQGAYSVTTNRPAEAMRALGRTPATVS